MIPFLEKKFGIHLQTYTSHGIILSLPYFTGALCSLGISVVFAHLLPKEEYGIYKILLSISAILGAFTLTGMNAAVTQAIAQGNKGVYRASVRYQLKWNAVVSLIAIAAVLVFDDIRQGLPLAVFFPIILGTTFLTAYNTYVAYYNGTKQFKTVSFTQMTLTLLQTTSSILIAIASKSGAHIVAGIFIVQAGTTYYFHRRIIRRSVADNSPETQATIAYGKKLTYINIFKTLSEQADKVATFVILGPVALAVYSFAYALPDQIRGFFKIIPTLSLPYFSEKDDARIRTVLIRYLLLLFGALALIAAVYALIAPFVYRFLFAPYTESVPYSQLIGVTMIPLVVGMPLISYLQARKKARTLSWINVFQAILDIGGVVYLGSRFGLWGVVYARAISSTVVAMLLIGTVFRSSNRVVPEVRN